ncbi:serine/threonine protein kinase [Cohnella zeiphila]|uniref:Serine/threonine protein kinase n=1 Tax=Cohnella zeiphila TaxID=2761120 RepID=A0A7X0SKB5_9BACL|nr:serine/threonine protein kinase [Cohnella zeiphila]MBB6731578.1 serine/threonine protein kinase [Cohnella zeiphila]
MNRFDYSFDGVAFQLREPHDMEWLRSLGKVFCVFDQQDSGNIAFGIEKDGKRSFVKYAGARPMDYVGDPQEAVARLTEAIPLYSALQHPHLIRLTDHFRTGSGHAAVFDWFDGECLHSHWSFAGPAKYNHPDSPFYKFKHLPLEKRLQALDAIFSFHVHVESQGYVAVDFYDGSILYDFSNDVTRICDIDFYRRAPSVNEMGENFWGAKRSKAPEEFELGAPIDARTNVFTMGAVAFGLLGGETDRSFAKWEAGSPLYEVALRAVREDRALRYGSVRAFKSAWEEARGK